MSTSLFRRRGGVGAALTGLALVGGVLVAPAAQAETFRNFRVGIQLADSKGTTEHGDQQFTNLVSYPNSESPWASDANFYDPDAMAIILDMPPGSQLVRLDFRIGAQANDRGVEEGPVKFTRWASEGGGMTDLVTDNNGHDPDAYRLFIESRPWPNGRRMNDFRLTLEAVDDGKPGKRVSTPPASQGGGRSAWGIDLNGYDPDGIRIGIEVS